MNPAHWTRRHILRTGLAASALPSLPSSALGEDPPKAKAHNASLPPRTLFLFLDWFHVKKGELQARLDPERISDEGRKILEMYARDFNKHFPRGPHGFEAVDVPFGIRIVQEVARHAPEPWLKVDQPWEDDIAVPGVLFDEGRYRCWYHVFIKGEKIQLTFDQGRAMELTGGGLGYAESTDGWNWTKPKKNIVTMAGQGGTNLLSPHGIGGIVFRDDHGIPEERYKCFHFDELPKDEVPQGATSHQRYGLYGLISPDGYHWTRKAVPPLVRYFSDTDNVAAWDPLLGKYVGYFRHHLAGRTISRAETDDYWNWPPPQPLLYPDPQEAPADDYYMNAYTTYPDDPSLRLLFPPIYHRDNDSVDTRMAVSRDGRAYQWVSYQPIIPLGEVGTWNGGSLYGAPKLVHLPDGKLALAYQASKGTHNEAFFRYMYGKYDNNMSLGWALWDDGRLAGIQADHVGQFTTNAASFRGKQIQINARTTRAGSVEIELRERGKPIEGFSFTDCVPFSGDEIWTTYRWKGKSDLSGLKGKDVELAVRLRSAKIFGYRFV
jgi:hypothetical protein